MAAYIHKSLGGWKRAWFVKIF